MTGDIANPSRANDPEFESHALSDALEDVSTGDELRATLVAAESYRDLVTMIDRMESRDAGRALLASTLEDIRRQGRVLAP
jgi:hypothetical protein